MAESLRVKELLEKIKSGAKRGSIQQDDVEEALSDEAFLTADGLLTADDNGDILLHLAAKTKGVAVLPLVSEEYKRLKVFAAAILKLNKVNKSPLHMAIEASLYDNVTQLFKDCLDLCPKALEPLENGWSLMHSAVQDHKNVNTVKYFLSQDICKPMLLSVWKRDAPPHGSFLPLDIVNDQVRASEISFRFAENFFEDHATKQPYTNSFLRSSAYSVQVEPKKKSVEGYKELRSLLEPPTMEMKAEEAKRLAKERTEQKLLAVATKTKSELQELLLSSNWERVVEKYLLSEQEQIQKVTVRFLGERHAVDVLSDTKRPQLPDNALKHLANFLALTDDDLTVKGALRLLKELTLSKESSYPTLDHEELQLGNKILHLLLSSDTEIQKLCAAILLNRFRQRSESFENPTEDSELIQSLLLVKCFSQDEEARSLVSEALQSLGVKRKQPNPGSWTVRQVSFWMESRLDLDCRSEFSKKFREANIDGLHLLELTSLEMSGLGIKFVSHQRKVASLIDELRRMNMRSIVGHKDIFLSYAHININFARRIKSLLNDNDYTVWIDEAGIRAGQKWRNEIADGIQGCSVFLFIMTPRSANSEYCQDEIALAEEYHKPIMTVRLEAINEMDPGLKLIIQRRQWMDFMDESLFESNKMKLIEAIASAMGPGSGPEAELDETDGDGQEHNLADNPEHSSEVPAGDLTVGAEVVTKGFLEKEISREVEKVREEFRAEIQQLRTMVKELSERLDNVEQT